jgi:hypothetical protein
MPRVDYKEIRQLSAEIRRFENPPVSNIRRESQYNYLAAITSGFKKTAQMIDKYIEPKRYMKDGYLGKKPIEDYYKLKKKQIESYFNNDPPSNLTEEKSKLYVNKGRIIEKELVNTAFLLNNFDAFDSDDGQDGNIAINTITTNTVFKKLIPSTEA